MFLDDLDVLLGGVTFPPLLAKAVAGRRRIDEEAAMMVAAADRFMVA